jgi:hypothetical protein
MNKNTTIQALAREGERQLKIDGPCVVCQEPELSVLKNVDRGLLEQHHVFGKNHESETTVPLCLNCHAKLHERMRDDGVVLNAVEDVTERFRQVIRMIAHFFRLMSEGLFRFLDQNPPGVAS